MGAAERPYAAAWLEYVAAESGDGVNRVQGFACELLTALGLDGGARVLDLGCGAGTFLEAYAEMGGRPERYVGVDADPTLIAHCRSAHPPEATFETMDLTAPESLRRLAEPEFAADAVVLARLANYLDGPALRALLDRLAVTHRGAGCVLVAPAAVGPAARAADPFAAARSEELFHGGRAHHFLRAPEQYAAALSRRARDVRLRRAALRDGTAATHAGITGTWGADVTSEAHFFGISKFSMSTDTWRTLRSGFRRAAPDLARRARRDFEEEGFIVTEATRPITHPSDFEIDGVDQALLYAFDRSKVVPSVMARRDPLSTQLNAALEGPLEGARITAYAALSEFGSLMLITHLAQAADAPVERLRQASVRRALGDLAGGPMKAAVAADLRAFARETTGVEAVLEGYGSTYLFALLPRAGAERFDPLEAHRLEDGREALDDASEALNLRDLGVTQAHVGWGVTTLIGETPEHAVFVLPSIVAVDGLYSITTVQKRVMLAGEDHAPAKASAREIAAELSALEAAVFDAERLNIERRRLEENFKPWQRGVYARLFEYWRMASSLEAHGKIMALRRHSRETALAAAATELERRQNGILAIIGALQLLAIASSVVGFLELAERSERVPREVYLSDAFWVAAVATPAVTLGALIVLLWLYFQRR